MYSRNEDRESEKSDEWGLAAKNAKSRNALIDRRNFCIMHTHIAHTIHAI